MKKTDSNDEYIYQIEPVDVIKPLKAYGDNIKDILKVIDSKKTNLIVKQISKPKNYNLKEFK